MYVRSQRITSKYITRYMYVTSQRLAYKYVTSQRHAPAWGTQSQLGNTTQWFEFTIDLNNFTK